MRTEICYQGKLFPSDPEKTVPISMGLSRDGIIVLWASRIGAEEILSWGDAGIAMSTQTPQGHSVSIARYNSDGDFLSATSIENFSLCWPFIGEFPNGDICLVAARCAFNQGQPENNARIYDSDGNFLREGCFGDGVEHLAIDDNGLIWVGYFDEGIFGNRGWDNPLGAAGIVAWSADFHRNWEMPDYLIADTYSLNIANQEVISCPYTGLDNDFPFVRIRDGKATTWETNSEVSGPFGVVSNGWEYVTIGSYEHSLAFSRHLLEGNRLRSSRSGVLSIDEGGTALLEGLQGKDEQRRKAGPVWDKVICRGRVAHFFVGSHWFTYEME
ncbi:MAG: hypothetical protein Q4C87_06030 [Actinomycetaceae bacterium]|nr:hypothetical protein [Actinomycetaceae bacterium]